MTMPLLHALPCDRTFRALVRALSPLLRPCTLLGSGTREWSSATFEGARHRLRVRLDGDAAGARAIALAAALPEAELAVRGAFVADLAIAVADEDVLLIEALTIDEA